MPNEKPRTEIWQNVRLPVVGDTNDANHRFDLSNVEPRAPVNLRVAADPYPHLRDDGGVVLARDYMDVRKLSYILRAVEAYRGEG